MLSGVRWGWVILGVLLSKIAVIPVGYGVIWLYARAGIEGYSSFDPIAYFIFPQFFLLTMFVFGYLVAWKAGSRFVLHGSLVGFLAALVFVPVLILAPSLFENHVLEIASLIAQVAGGFLGGLLAARTRRRGATV